MATYLKGRQHYEDRYDRRTVEIGWEEAHSFMHAREEFYKQADMNKKDKEVMEFWWERFYWWLVEVPTLLVRWENKDTTIERWMLEDRVLDERIAEARPTFEPTCEYCGQQGLRLKLKELMHRGSGTERAVLFMFDCLSCKKRTAYWEDGAMWESRSIPCPKCGHVLEMDVKVKGRLMTTTYVCEDCGHKEVGKTHLGQKEKEDPLYERKKELFCLTDERAEIMMAYRMKWHNAQRMMDEHMERATKQEVYDAVTKVTQLKVTDLIDILKPAIEKVEFIEVRFEKPVITQEFSVEFSCLDKDSSRSDSRSRTALKKAVDAALSNTNWRLMSDGISYRLGYLSGRVRAYEDEKTLADLIEREARRQAKKKTLSSGDDIVSI